MGLLVQAIAVGFVSAVVLGFAYWGILVFLRPSLDSLRAVVHRNSVALADAADAGPAFGNFIAARAPMAGLGLAAILGAYAAPQSSFYNNVSSAETNSIESSSCHRA